MKRGDVIFDGMVQQTRETIVRAPFSSGWSVPDDVPIEVLPGLNHESKTFLNAAAVTKGLDLVTTCDTSIAHLARARGAPIWMALRCACDWRWMLDREDNPWYPSMRQFRQIDPGDWAG